MNKESLSDINNPITAKKKLKSELKAADLRVKQAKAEEIEAKLKKGKEKSDIEQENSIGKFGTPLEPRKSLSTYLRNQNKFEVSGIAILDRKAAILIRICTTVISGLIVFYQYIEDNVPGSHVISIVLLIGLLASLILAIIATKPFTKYFTNKISSEIQEVHPSFEENCFLLLSKCSLKNYEEAMEKVVKSQNLQLGNQIRANFILARHNAYKANLISNAYNAFLISFIIAGSIFILSRYGLI